MFASYSMQRFWDKMCRTTSTYRFHFVYRKSVLFFHSEIAAVGFSVCRAKMLRNILHCTGRSFRIRPEVYRIESWKSGERDVYTCVMKQPDLSPETVPLNHCKKNYEQCPETRSIIWYQFHPTFPVISHSLINITYRIKKLDITFIDASFATFRTVFFS